MKRAVTVLKRLLYPPAWALIFIPALSFTALAYIIYSMSAYSLTVLIAAAPRLVRRIKSAFIGSRPVREIAELSVTKRYLSDPAFRGSTSVCIGIY